MCPCYCFWIIESPSCLLCLFPRSFLILYLVVSTSSSLDKALSLLLLVSNSDPHRQSPRSPDCCCHWDVWLSCQWSAVLSTFIWTSCLGLPVRSPVPNSRDAALPTKWSGALAPSPVTRLFPTFHFNWLGHWHLHVPTDWVTNILVCLEPFWFMLAVLI